MSKMLRFRDTAFLKVPISQVKLAPLARSLTLTSLRSQLSNEPARSIKCFAFTTSIVYCAGSTAADEMCNLYMMFYTALDGPDFTACSGVSLGLEGKVKGLPEGNDVPLPPNPKLEMHSHGKMHKVNLYILCFTDEH